MPIRYEHREALQQLVTAYWQASDKKDFPDWFYTVLDFMETECGRRMNTVTGAWEAA